MKKTLTITAEQKTAQAEAIKKAKADGKKKEKQAAAKPAEKGKVVLRYSDDGSSMIFGNGVVELTITKATGYIQKITNKVSGRDYKIKNDNPRFNGC